MRIFLKLVVFFAAAAPVFAGTDQVRLPSDEALDPVSSSGRPWVVAHSPDAKQLVESFRLLGESAAQAGEAYAELTRAAAEAESSFVSAPVPSPKIKDGTVPAAGRRAFRVEGPLKDALAQKTEAAPGGADHLAKLERALAAESRRLDRLGSSMEALLRLDRTALAKRRVRRAIKRLDKRIRALRGSYASLREGIDLLGLSASWYGEKIGTSELARALRLQNSARGLDWKLERLGMSVRSLRARAR